MPITTPDGSRAGATNNPSLRPSTRHAILRTESLAENLMRIADALNIESIDANVDLDSKNDVLLHLVDLIGKAGVVTDIDKVRDVIFKREEIMSTGVGQGFAVPHAKTNAVNKTSAALLTLSQPVDYQSLDNQPVQIVIMLVGPEDAFSAHLRLLSRISRLMTDSEFRTRLAAAGSAQELYQCIDDEESRKLDL